MRPSRLLTCLLLGLLASAPAVAAAAFAAVVQDPYLELRTGPGRGFPVAQVVDRGAEVTLLRRRTDWIKVRTAGGVEGWVNRAQLERTLTPSGESVTLPGPSPESRVEHRWELGVATGDTDGASTIAVSGAYLITHRICLARLEPIQLPAESPMDRPSLRAPAWSP